MDTATAPKVIEDDLPPGDGGTLDGDEPPAPEPAEPPVEAPDSSPQIRTYVVLREVEAGVFTLITEIDAPKAETALRNVAAQLEIEMSEKDTAATVTLAAVPVRSWSPTLVSVAVERSVSITVCGPA